MTRLSRSITTLLCVGLLASCESPVDTVQDTSDDLLTTSFAKGGNGPAVTGSGMLTFAYGQRTFTINARAGDGFSASGTMTLMAGRNKPRVGFHGTVTCMRVDGNVAYVGGVVKKADDSLTNPAFQVGANWAMVAIDNGEGKKAPADVMSLVSFNSFDGYAAGVCDGTFSGPAPVYEIEGGNLQVRGGAGGGV